MYDAQHQTHVNEARADKAVLHDLRQRIGDLRGSMSPTAKAEFDALCREFATVRDDFETLHRLGATGHVDRAAHRDWRARAESLTARVIEFSGASRTDRPHML